MKLSQVVVKLAVRLFFILLLVALALVVANQNSLQHLGNFNMYDWHNVFPVLLIAGFTALLIICSIKKYQQTDLNWLLVINTVMLLAYGVAVSLRIAQLMH